LAFAFGSVPVPMETRSISLSPAGQLSAPIKAQQGYYVVKVLERVPPDMGGLAAEREKIQKEVLVQKQSLAWESWINGARANSKIETHLPASRRG